MIIEVSSQKNADLLEEKMNETKVCIILYYSLNCIHCKLMLPEWHKLEKKYKNNNNCIVAKVESENMNLLHNKPFMVGYPTIHKYKNGTKEEYNGDRSCEDLVKFANVKKTSKKTKTKTKGEKESKSSKSSTGKKGKKGSKFSKSSTGKKGKKGSKSSKSSNGKKGKR